MKDCERTYVIYRMCDYDHTSDIYITTQEIGRYSSLTGALLAMGLKMGKCKYTIPKDPWLGDNDAGQTLCGVEVLNKVNPEYWFIKHEK